MSGCAPGLRFPLRFRFPFYRFFSILRAFGKSTILENNIVPTTGSAGESVAAGVIFTLPALIFLGFSLNTEYWRFFFWR